MRIKLKILLLFILVKNPLVFAQIDDLSILDNLTNNLSQSTSQSENNSNPNLEEKNNKNTPPEKKDFIDDQYGYTGGKNFNSSPKSKFSDQALEYFGYSYFSDQPSTFAPLNNVPVPPDYLIGPDDNIKIILFGINNKTYELRVTRDGDILIPEIGPLYVAGITFKDLKELIQETISNQLIGTQVSVTLGALRSIDIFILGAANNPGMYSISALSTLTNAIIKSGGIDISGSLRNIKLKRSGEVITSFDFYDLLLNGDTRNDARLMQGDVVFIEPIGKTAAINGEINRSGIFELKEDENLNDLIRYAGNFKPKANLSTAQITRINSLTYSFDLISLDLTNQRNEDLAIQSGDVISIYPVTDSLKKAVLISGHAKQPGFYPWTEGMKIKDLFDSADDLLEMTDLNYVLIKTKDINSHTFQFSQVDLEELFNDPESRGNVVLSDQDEIILFPSILSSDLITTRMITDRYLLDKKTNKMVLEDQWTSLTYLRKSQMELDQQLPIPEQNLDQDKTNMEQDTRRYYEYSIYDYCLIPDNIVDLVTADNFETESNINKLITNVCRQQLLDPSLDLIKRNNKNERLGIVTVFGNVHFPGTYPYVRDMILSHAIKAAGGSKTSTYNAEIEISTRNSSGKKISSSNNFASIEEVNEIKLQAMDTVTLKQIFSDIGSVEIKGEVFFPGTYPISEKQSLLSLVNRAGGLTELSSPEAAYFQRQSLKEYEQKRLKTAQEELTRKILMSGQSNLGQDELDQNDIAQLITVIDTSNAEETEALGRLVIDLQGILDGEVDDILLEDGDVINIPRRKQSVSVIGEVFVTNTHLHDKSLTIQDYISLSGGVTSFADNNNIYLIKSDGSIVSPSQLSSGFFRASGSIIDPGDTIVVPLELQPFSTIKATTEITQIIYQMALAAAAVNSF